MKKILFLSAFSTMGASGLLGGPIYRDCFVRSGYVVKFLSRNSKSMDSMVLIFGQKSPRVAGILSILLQYVNSIYAFFIDWYSLRIAKNYDVICLLKIQSLTYVQKLRLQTKARIVLYFGDAVWLYKDNGHFNTLLCAVDAVATDNEYTASYVRKFNNNCKVVPDYPQIEFFDKNRSRISKVDNIIRIGWIGSPSTTYNLFLIWEVLERIFKKFDNLHLRLLGTGYIHRVLPNFENVKVSMKPSYTQKEMIEESLSMHIGLFPLQDVERSKVRGILKALVYMGGEAAVIASPVGQIKDVIVDGVNGMLAKNEIEWEEKLERLITDRILRTTISKNGLKLVQTNFTKAICYSKLITALNGE